MSMPQVGDPAPAFNGRLEDGRQVSLADYRGKHLVLYFYPKDDTPGCTKEACGFRDHYAALQEAGAEILGVSADSAAKHQKFIAKYELPFSLLADEDKQTIQAYGAWGEKSMYGKKYMGIVRTTVVVDPEGRVKAVFPKVKPAEHAEEILKVLQG